MATIHFDGDETAFDVTVKESDKYTKLVYLKLESHCVPKDLRPVKELFLTVHQLEVIGRFFLEEAAKISRTQSDY